MGSRIYEFPNGIRYEGQVDRAGLPNGLGVITYPNASKYDGEWKEGMKEGRGKQSFSSSEQVCAAGKQMGGMTDAM